MSYSYLQEETRLKRIDATPFQGGWFLEYPY